jgi:hypothetical protein
MLVLQPAGATLRDAVTAINQLMQGRSNATGQVTLTASAATTVLSKTTVNEDAEVFLIPRTANAAAELAAGTAYISDVSRGSFTITHANNAQSDRTFGYIVIGG